VVLGVGAAAPTPKTTANPEEPRFGGDRMAKLKYDVVVEAVHYTPEGQVDWVRAYKRRGPVFSDHLKIDRQALINSLKSGKRIVIGKRLPYMGATFDVSESLSVKQIDGREILVVGDDQTKQDHLSGVPII
jgi:hypothetical protein